MIKESIGNVYDQSNYRNKQYDGAAYYGYHTLWMFKETNNFESQQNYDLQDLQKWFKHSRYWWSR